MTDLKDSVLPIIRDELDMDEVAWSEPPPAKKKNTGRSNQLSAIYALLKLVPGQWLRVGPVSGGSYHGQARAHGMEVTARYEPGGNYLYLRAPEVSS